MPALDELNRRALLRSLMLGGAWLLGTKTEAEAADSANAPVEAGRQYRHSM